MYRLVILALLVVGITGAYAQTDTGFPEPVQKDTVCFSYRFIKGDSLVYRVVSTDTIVFKDQPPLVKERVEMVALVCDSVGRNGHFYMRQTLKDYIAKESLLGGDLREVVRTESPWIGRTAEIEIDSMGVRYNATPADTSAQSALAPGGAFQPPLLVGIYDSCKSVHQSWLVDRVEEVLPENGYPPPVRRQTSLFTAYAPIDTLGFTCRHFHYALTGQGFVEVTDRKPAMRIMAVLAEHGEMKISAEHGVPVHFYGESQVKMEITTSDGALVKGTQYIHSWYTMEEFYRNGKKLAGDISTRTGATGSGKRKAPKK